MRRKDREVTDFSTMLNIVRACDCCRIGLVDGTKVYIVPLNFGYETGDDTLTLYFHSAPEGHKIDLLRGCADVSFEMDARHELVRAQEACDHTFRYACVMGTGRMEIVTDAAEKQHGMQMLMARYTGRMDWPFHAARMDAAAVLRLRVEDWSCKVHD